MTHECAFCHKSFAKETTLAVHVCEQRRRRQVQNEPGVRLGFQAYIRFYETLQGSARLKTYDDFCESSYYKAFVKFGHYCVNTRVINPPRFIDLLLKHNKKIDRWPSDAIYNEFLVEYMRVESVNDALARAIEFSIDWAEKTGHPAQDCLRYGNANAMCYAVTTGRISAWVIYASESGQQFLDQLTTEQLQMTWPYIDADFWQHKFKEYVADYEYAREMLKKAGW